MYCVYFYSASSLWSPLGLMSEWMKLVVASISRSVKRWGLAKNLL